MLHISQFRVALSSLLATFDVIATKAIEKNIALSRAAFQLFIR